MYLYSTVVLYNNMLSKMINDKQISKVDTILIGEEHIFRLNI